MNARWLFSLAAAAALAAPLLAQPAQPIVLKGQAHSIASLAWSADGRTLSSATGDGTTLSWDVATGKASEPSRWESGDATAIGPNGGFVATAARDRLVIRTLPAGKQLASFNPHTFVNPMRFPFRPRVAAMEFRPDGQRLATAASEERVGGPHGLPGGVVTVWDVSSGKVVAQFEKLSTGAGAVAWSGDGQTLAAGTNGAGGELPEPGEVRIWEVASSKELQRIRVKPQSEPGEFASVSDVALSPDGQRVAIAAGSGSRGAPAGIIIEDSAAAVRIVQVSSGKTLAAMKGHAAGVGRIVFSPDGAQVATAGKDRTVRVWDSATGKELAVFAFDVPRIDAIAFSGDGKSLAAGGSDGTARIWPLPAAKP